MEHCCTGVFKIWNNYFQLTFNFYKEKSQDNEDEDSGQQQQHGKTRPSTQAHEHQPQEEARHYLRHAPEEHEHVGVRAATVTRFLTFQNWSTFYKSYILQVVYYKKATILHIYIYLKIFDAKR